MFTRNIFYSLLLVLSFNVSATEIRFNNGNGLEQLPNSTVWSITQDDDGLLWFSNDKGLFSYDGYTVKSISESILQFSIKGIRSVVHDKGEMIFGTRNNGLYLVKEGNLKKIYPNKNETNNDANKISSVFKNDDGLWFGALNSLVFTNSYDVYQKHEIPNALKNNVKFKVMSIIQMSNSELFIATQYSTFIFNTTTKSYAQYPIIGFKESYIRSAFKDEENNIWLATDDGAYFKSFDDDKFERALESQIDFPIYSILVENKNIWVGTIKKGLLKLSQDNLSTKTYKNNTNDNTSIAGNSIVKMFIDKNGVLFFSSFHGGVSQLNTHSLEFGLISNTNNGFQCSQSSVIYGIDVEGDNIWLASDSGLIEYNPLLDKCINYKELDINKDLSSGFNPQYTFKDSQNKRWIINLFGLSSIDEETGKISLLPFVANNLFINTMIETEQNRFLIGTENGLYRLDNNQFNKINISNLDYKKINVVNFTKINDQQYYVATKHGIAFLDENDNFSIIDSIQSQLPTKNLSYVHVDNKNNIWVGTRGFGMYSFSKSGKLLFNARNTKIANTSVLNFLAEDDNLWSATDNGLLKINIDTHEYKMFSIEDGLQDNRFNIYAVFKTDTGKLYFGGANGLNAFDPKKISVNSSPPNIVLTDLTRFGKKIIAGETKDDFSIIKPINQLKELVLTHKDYVIGFEFAAIDYVDPNRNQYAFKLEGLDPDWNFVNADDRKISYSNLKAGQYTFRVKGSNSDGVWNEEGKSLKVIMLPAPWLTWWAYTLYAMTFFALLSLYIHKKNKANIRINKKLKKEVKRQTKQLSIQKQKVETLLERKNEMFANVSHEFRTPLTLILGPINQMLQSNLSNKNNKSLKMVNRNAKRLLVMIEQFLLLAKMTNPEKVSFIAQQVDPSIENIVHSFQTMAEQKNISLNLVKNDEAAIKANQNAIEIILGNLISNAIKYTQNDGKVSIVSKKIDNTVYISVIDTGCGLNEIQQKEIFNRFNRLDIHQNIPGVGIGLSVVKEIVKLNKGNIKVSSEVNKGSTFTVSFPCVNLSKNTQDIEIDNTLINKLIEESNSEHDEKGEDVIFVGDKKNKIILIIDDNKDMRTHVADTLKHKYYCILADRGKLGISFANKYVPDIIICDVMMPEMDGFTVSRILRSDTSTSHIPLILLTALNDKKSRIKGWRENIDQYLTKPFDADELLVQLENILVIRNILSKKAGTAIKAGKFSMNSGLPEKDRLFVEKFINVISDNFTRFDFLRPEMASMMAVSERQLQRKIKALIDKNPLDLLREFRLEKATHILKDGYQIALTADKCGFNTVTYFSKCFKETYGMSPKEYQMSFKNNKK